MEVKKTKILISGSLGILSVVPIELICNAIFSFVPMVDLDYTLIYVSKTMNMFCQHQQTHRMLIERIYGKGSAEKLKPLIKDLIENRKPCDWRKCLKRLISISLRTTVCVDTYTEVVLPESPSSRMEEIQISVLKEFTKEVLLKNDYLKLLKILRGVGWWDVSSRDTYRDQPESVIGHCAKSRGSVINERITCVLEGEGYVKGDCIIEVGVFSQSKLRYGRRYVKVSGDKFRLAMCGYFCGESLIVEGRTYDHAGKLHAVGSFHEGVLAKGKMIIRNYRLHNTVNCNSEVTKTYEGIFENGYLKEGTESFVRVTPIKMANYTVRRAIFPDRFQDLSYLETVPNEVDKFVGKIFENQTRFGILYLKNGAKLKETLKCPENSQSRVDGHFLEFVLTGYGRHYYSDMDGQILYQGNFFDDNFHGLGILYDRNGKRIYEGNFKFNVKEGWGKEYHDDGSTVKFEGLFINGIPKSGNWFTVDGKKRGNN